MLLYHRFETNWTAVSLRHQMSSVKAQSYWSIIHTTQLSWHLRLGWHLIFWNPIVWSKVTHHLWLRLSVIVYYWFRFFLWLFSSAKKQKSKESQQEEKSDTQEKKKKKTKEKVNVFATPPVSCRRHTNGIAVHGGDARTRIRFAHHRRWRKKRTKRSRPCPKNQRRRRRRSKRRDSWRSKRRRRRRRVDGDGWKILLFSSWIGPHPSPPPPPHTNSNTGHIGECRVEQFSPSLLVRWEEEKYEDGVKWKFLEHKGPYFPPEYQPLPGDVHFYYGGEWSSDAQGGWRGNSAIYLCFKKRWKERKNRSSGDKIPSA